jgi:hypothetical protein
MFMTRRPDGAKEADGDAQDPAINAYVFLRATVDQAMAEGRFRDGFTDVNLIAQTLWAATHGVVSLEVAKGNEKKWVEWRPLSERMEAMMNLLIDSLVKG